MEKKAKTWLGVGAGVLVLGGIISLFQDDDDKTDTATAQPKTSASAPATADGQTTAPATTSGIPSPDTAQTARLVAALREVHPGLVTKEAKAISRARDVCLDITQGKDSATIRGNAKQRFQGGDVALSDDQADKVVKAVEGSFCH
ncbi:hypothetical protein I5Q34_19675 [Streptomyces sp. AV19]|uniref:hypothetical protein n=1 Tax=Streptomyces sp. AV19 TaxID=2793068 RepID=UPI0018FE4ECD|nr:hypothetical protein [Streptomyces sp. AV19]MBH1936468.1 hypothetical protein [Streptomyces sp. AV19]MDG4532524.1 hypothetical protein [Streptomyces sp. AV19]